MCVWVAINAIVFVNAVLHTPFIGYDAADHREYIVVLAQGRLPGPGDTTEFFAAPLPYVGPAVLTALQFNWGLVLKLAQMQNVACSIGLTLALVSLCRRMRPGDRAFPLWTLVLLGSVPLYYKMFAFVRGEPLTAFLSVLLVERVVAYVRQRSLLRDALIIGAVAGALMLSKQWGAFVAAPALLWLWWRRPAELGRVTAAVMVALLICGWFFLSLHLRFGSAAAFNIPRAPAFRLDNLPAYFYTGHGWPTIVTDPVREALLREGEIPLWPLLYADAWGDYWCYWVVRGIREEGGWLSGPLVSTATPALSNRDAMGAYLGRVNVAGAIPTLVMIAGVAFGLAPRRRAASDVTSLPAIIVIGTAAGYLALLIAYPGLGVKSGYQLHALPFLALLGGTALVLAPGRARAALQIVIVLAALHNAPVFFTRYIWSWYGV